jgi:putative transcriptional regulator
MEKRNLFDEIMNGINAMGAEREKKITLKSYTKEASTPFNITPELIRETREKLNLSRAVFANMLHIAIRTLENWEQGRSNPNNQAAALILLVRQYPDTLQRLQQLNRELYAE